MNFPFTSITMTLNVSRYITVVCMMALAIALLTACGGSQSKLIQITGSTMGTSYHIKVVAVDLESAALKLEIDRRLIALNDVFSTYIPGSEISRLNALQSVDRFDVSAEFLGVLSLSREIYTLSDGAFDITMGPLVNLWGFGPQGPRNGLPSDADIAVRLENTGFEKVLVDGHQISRPVGIQLDLSAIAKGYAVDKIAELLEGKGVNRYMVEIGGEVRTRGTNDRDQSWIIGIEAPDMSSRQLLRTIAVKDMSMATSGDYRNFFTADGKTYSHTIDPKTGWPVDHGLASVTVLHASAGFADGLATAFSVLGLDKTMAIAQEHDLLVLAIIRREDTYEQIYSSAMKQYLAAD
jgi:thiamine biosynthesis lipoprotein